jgi:hypothetical protein
VILGGNSDHSSFFFQLPSRVVYIQNFNKKFLMLKICDFVGFERQKYFFSFSLAFLLLFLVISMIFSQLTHYIYCRTPYMIYMFGFVTSAQLPSIYVALWWAATLYCTPTADMYRLLLVAPLPPARLSAKKSEQLRRGHQSSVSAYTSIYYRHTHTHSGGEQTKPSDIVYFDSSKRTILFLPVCAIHKLRYSIHCLSFDCVMRQFVLYHLIKAPALFLMCLLLGYV